jgi:hypothetical protein
MECIEQSFHLLLFKERNGHIILKQSFQKYFVIADMDKLSIFLLELLTPLLETYKLEYDIVTPLNLNKIIKKSIKLASIGILPVPTL